MTNALYVTTSTFIFLAGAFLYIFKIITTEKKYGTQATDKILKNATLVKISYLLMGFGALMILAYVFLFTTDGLYGPLP